MALTWAHVLQLVILGAAAGCAGSLTGIGGGLIITPILTLSFGVPIHQAIATSLCCVIATSSGAAARFIEQRLVDIRLGMTLELATTLGAIGGSVVAGFLSRKALAALFATIAFYAGWMMVRRAFTHESVKIGTSESYQVKRLPFGLIGSGGAGIISGLLGVGGGVVKVPLMYLMMGVPFKTATATSNFMIGVTAAASAFIYYARGDVRPEVTAPAAFGVFVGASMGAHLLRRTPNRWLILAFSGIVFYFAVILAWKAFYGGFSR